VAEYFEHYPTPVEKLVGIANQLSRQAGGVDTLVQGVSGTATTAQAAVDGDLATPMATAAPPVLRTGDSVAAVSHFGSGAISYFAQAVTTYNRGIDRLNAQITEGNVDATAGGAQRLRELRAEQARLRAVLDGEAAAVANLLQRGPNNADMAFLRSQGYLPATAAALPFRPGEGDGDARWPSLEQILEWYQVRDDPGGVLQWEPSWPWNIWTDPKQVTATEAEMLNRLDVFDLKAFGDMYEEAYQVADQRFLPEDQDDNHNDAFRHAYWSAMMTRHFGEPWARDYTNAHEGLPGNPQIREAMDLYNNEVGRRIAVENSNASHEELANLIAKAVRDGQMVVVGPDGNLAWSNTVPEGETGDVTRDFPAGPPGGNPQFAPDTDS
jgi:hypothetical protein